MDINNRSNPAPPFFVIGCGRSGSTMLRLMLDRHSELMCAKESYFIPNLRWHWRPPMSAASRSDFLDRLNSIPSAPEQTLVDYLGWTRPELERLLLNHHEADYATVVQAIYEQKAWQQGKVYWGDKTPFYIRHLSTLNALFPGSRFVHLLRDGRDVALSYVKYTSGPNSLGQAAYYWRREVMLGRRFAANNPAAKYCEVKYEHLVTQPEPALRYICGFLGVEFEPTMLAFHDDAAAKFRPGAELQGHELVKKPPQSSRIGRWRDEMSAREQAQFDVIAGTLLGALGYERSDHHQPYFMARVTAKSHALRATAIEWLRQKWPELKWYRRSLRERLSTRIKGHGS